MSKLNIKIIPIEDALQLNWDIGFCSNDFAYLKYGKTEELVLSIGQITSIAHIKNYMKNKFVATICF